MEQFKRNLALVGLLAISLAASLFMVMESGAFYQRLYPQSMAGIPMGYLAAFLNEGFMALMAGVWLPALKAGKWAIVHPANFLFKFLLLLLFLTTVGGASFNVIEDSLKELETQKNRQELIRLLQQEVKEQAETLRLFKDQNQRTNSALTARARLKARQELKEAIEGQANQQRLWISVAFVVILRFAVQLANLSSVWLAGWLYRQPLKNTKPQDLALAKAPELPLAPVEAKAINQPLLSAESPPVPNLDKPDPKPNPTLTSRRLRLAKDGVKQAKAGRVLAATPAQPTAPQSEPHPVPAPSSPKVEEPHPAAPLALKPAMPEPPLAPALAKPHPPEQAAPPAPAPAALPPKEEDQELLQEVQNTRKKIIRLLNSRNKGVPLSQFCRAIGEEETRLRRLVEQKEETSPEHLEDLKEILFKIEELYQEEFARSG